MDMTKQQASRTVRYSACVGLATVKSSGLAARYGAAPLGIQLLVTFLMTAGFACADERISFNADVRPILSDLCFQCHGPDSEQRQAGLRLDNLSSASAELESGHRAVVSGDAASSEMIRRITSEDPDLVMPPPGFDKRLTAEQQETLQRWIESGAEYETHWAFISPVKSAPPESSFVSGSGVIDSWIHDGIATAGLHPSPEAAAETLIRRATLDLTGLPPKPEEVRDFLADKSGDAWEKLLDRLLNSPRYGEHMGRLWLDLARYGDTHGLHLDNERSLWKYRDWVVSAFNSNMPFDQFITEQLAGDLLPEPSIDQRVATGFNRCNVTTSEGGSINDEVLVRYAVDRTETMSTVFMGLTLGCAVCHDHKFDPISQREFYQLYAFFNASADAAMDGNALAPPPVIRVPSAEQTAGLQQLDQQLQQKRDFLRVKLEAWDYTDRGEQNVASSQAPGEPVDYVWIDDAAPSGANLQGDSAWEFTEAPDNPVHSGSKSTHRKAAGQSQHFFTDAAPGLRIGAGDRLFAWVWLNPDDPPQTIMLQFNDGSWSHRAFWGKDTIAWGTAGNADHRHLGDLPEAGKWVRLEVAAEHVGLAAGAELNGWAFTQFGGEVWWDTAGLVTRTPQGDPEFESLEAWVAWDKALPKSSVPDAVRKAAAVQADARTPEQSRQVLEYFLTYVHPQSSRQFLPLQQELDALQQKRDEIDGAIPVSMVMQDLDQPRETFILRRGEYDQRGDQVTAGVPAILPGMPEGAPMNRLGLAKWLTQRSHPLTARVAVNRIWQQIFGVGFVETSEDFGSQGQQPSHPELLDWLAVDFQEHNWDVKRLIRQILMSQTYRQKSDVTSQLLLADPNNRLLARAPRFRLDAEVVRDSALFVSGLLVEQSGGPSVRPYQPEGIWEAVAFRGSTTQFYKPDSGDSLYRRSMYTFWKRTAPPPSLMAFDAPSREICVSRRARTNTPMQALVLMNDVQYVEAARALAHRMLSASSDREQQLQAGFQLCTARQPGPEELQILQQTHEAHLAHYRTDPEAARQLLAAGASELRGSHPEAEHAAMAMTASLLLNLDETVTRE